MNDHVYHYDNDYQVFVIDVVVDHHVQEYVDDDVYVIYNVPNYRLDDDDDVVDDQMNVIENDHHEMIYFNKKMIELIKISIFFKFYLYFLSR
jgi:hypothetical protein